jgi:integrase
MRERRPGVWELIVQLPRDPSSVTPARQLSRTVHGTKRDAQRALAAMVADVAAGKVAATNHTFGELLARWLEVIDDHLSPTTVHEYHRLVRTMLDPALGKTSLRRLTTQRLDAYYQSLVHDHGLSPASIRHVHAVVRGSLGQAVKWGWIPTNPAASASPPKLKRHQMTPPTIADTRALLHAADDWDPEFGALLHVMAATGARRGEVCGLRWTDIDVDGRAILIRRSIATVAGGTIEKDTKTHAARRIAIDADTVEVLVRQRERLEERARVCEVVLAPDAYVFTHSANGRQPVHPDGITGGFRRLCDRVGVSGVRLHDLRHLHATQLLAAGVPVRTVSGRLGHADASTTLNVYAHFLEASDRQAADVIAGLLEQRPRSSSDDSTG